MYETFTRRPWSSYGTHFIWLRSELIIKITCKFAGIIFLSHFAFMRKLELNACMSGDKWLHSKVSFLFMVFVTSGNIKLNRISSLQLQSYITGGVWEILFEIVFCKDRVCIFGADLLNVYHAIKCYIKLSGEKFDLCRTYRRHLSFLHLV